MSRFVTTRWSLVLSARSEPRAGRQALEQLCRAYRPPVLAYVRAHGYPFDAAEDLVQAFFVRFVERESYADADAARGRFRTFLLTSVKRFLIDERKRASRLKRGGSQIVQSLDADPAAVDAAHAADDPEQVFEREWAQVVVRSALARLRTEAEAAGRTERFDRLSEVLTNGSGGVEYVRAAAEIGMRPNTVAVAVHRLRRRLRQMVLDVLKDTIADSDALKDEVQVLHAAAQRPQRTGS